MINVNNVEFEMHKAENHVSGTLRLWKAVVGNCTIAGKKFVLFSILSCENHFSKDTRKKMYTSQKMKFSIKISSVNVTKSVENCGFGHVY